MRKSLLKARFSALNFCLNSLYFLSLLGGKSLWFIHCISSVLANSKILPIFLRPSLKGLENRDRTLCRKGHERERTWKAVPPWGSGSCECDLWEKFLHVVRWHPSFLEPQFSWEMKVLAAFILKVLAMEIWVPFSVLTLVEVAFPAISQSFCPPPFHPSILSESISWESLVWLVVGHGSCPRLMGEADSPRTRHRAERLQVP